MNHRYSPSVIVAAALVTISASLSAQVAVGAPASFGGSSMHRLDDQRAHAIGADYRASIAADGVTFTLALGKRAPRTLPWRFELESVRRGEQVVHQGAPTDEGALLVEGARCDVVRGAGLVERYEARDEGLEQSFVFARLPGSGDLVVRGRVVSELVAAPASGARALDFGSPWGTVSVRDVVGIDALGRRCPGSMHWDGTHLDLVLDGAFVDGAAFPLVLDPLIGSPANIGLGTADDRDPQAAYSADVDRYLAVWTRYYSATDTEVYARLRSATNGVVVPMFPVTSGNNVLHVDPHVCAVAGTGKFVVAWQEGPGVFGPFDIWTSVVDGATATITAPLPATVVLSTTFPPSPIPTPHSEIRPRLCSNGAVTPGRVMLVYEVPGSGIESNIGVLGANGVAWQHLAMQVFAVTSPGATRPALSQSGGSRNVLAWVESNAAGIDVVKAQPLSMQTGTPAGAMVTFQATQPLHNPAVDGDGTEFRVLMEREMSLGANDIVCGVVSWNTAGVPTQAPGLQEIANAGADERAPAIAFLGKKYVTAWARRIGIYDYAVQVRGMGRDTACSDCGDTFVLGGTRDTEMVVAFGATRGTDANGDRALVVYSSADVGIQPISDVRGQLFVQFGGGSSTAIGAACGNATTLQGVGSFALGNPDFAFEASSAIGTPQLCLFSFGFSQQLISCGCQVVVPEVISMLLMNGGTATLPLPLPCNPTLNGAAMAMQAVVLDPAGQTNVCPLLPEASFSAARRWTFAW